MKTIPQEKLTSECWMVQGIKYCVDWKLSSECWMVQFNGIKYCLDCEYKNTEECGGENIRLSGKNDKGIEVPLKPNEE